MAISDYPELLALYQQRSPLGQSEISAELLALSDFVYQQTQKNSPITRDANLSLPQLLVNISTESQLKSVLRQYRNQILVELIKLEFSSANHSLQVMHCCSNLADECIQGALAWLSKDHMEKFGTPTSDSGDTQELIVLGMGKLGGKELNLSSDIDLIFTYPQSGHTQGGKRSIENEVFFHRLVQRFIGILNDVTQDGFVFRVDARLRPYGDSGPLVLSYEALSQYYLEQGRDWERFALVKARAITGTIAHVAALQAILKPFVYRRYIDFSMLESPRQMKLQIEIELRRRHLQHNLKLGLGGIREIEFIVQALQLIHGGKHVQLQTTSTLVGLDVIETMELLSKKQVKTLRLGYLKLRHWEHCLQGIADKQTQDLPNNELDKQRLCFIDSQLTWAAWQKEADAVRAGVHQIFLAQFRDESNTADIGVDTELTNLWRLPEVCEVNQGILSQLGYQDPVWVLKKLAECKDRLLQKSRPVSEKATLKLQGLVPTIIRLCGKEALAEQTFDRVFLLIDQILTRTAYLDLFVENRSTLELVIFLFARSPWIAKHTSQYPLVLDDLLNPQWQTQPYTIKQRQQMLEQTLARIPQDDEEHLYGVLREFKQSQHFQLAAGFISEQFNVEKLAKNLTAIADVIVRESLKMARYQIENRYGRLLNEQGEDADFVIVAMGKLGSREIGFSSDLDLIFLHENCENESTGIKSLEANVYFIKIAQRFIHILTTRMSSGVLYEIDTRLRPMGNSGLLVSSIEQFASYQKAQAWTWEHQALIRARVLSPSRNLAEKFEIARKQVLTIEREQQKLLTDVTEMREKMRQHFSVSTSEKWSLKQGLGGITDIEFFIQYLVLLQAHQHQELTSYTSMMELLKQLGMSGILQGEQVKLLNSAYQKYRDAINRQALQETEIQNESQWQEISEQVTEIIQSY